MGIRHGDEFTDKSYLYYAKKQSGNQDLDCTQKNNTKKTQGTFCTTFLNTCNSKKSKKESTNVLGYIP